MGEKTPRYKRPRQIKAVNKFIREHYDRLSLNLPKGEKQRWIEESQNLGFDNLTSFIRWAVESKIGKPPGNC